LTEPVIRAVSDTALWVAMYRAQETERPDALFRDPFAARLAGERGVRALERFSSGPDRAWPFVMRTHLIDRILEEQIAAGVDTVLNLGAGLDTRPYRLELPGDLRWYEVDLPELIEDKARLLTDEEPRCDLRRVALDVADVAARRRLLATIAGESRHALVLCEGLLIYLSEEAVATLAGELAAAPCFRSWVLDLVSPGLLTMIRREWGEVLGAAQLRFAPASGPAFFADHGWWVAETRSGLKEAARHKRLPYLLRLIALLPQAKAPKGKRRVWSAVCRFVRTPPA
jgi:methyltransferase (TIGR00027 family)